MSNEVLLNTLNGTLGELVAIRGEALAEVDACREAIQNANTSIERATVQENCAIQADELAKSKHTELANYINGLVDQPQALLEKVNRLRGEQIETYQKRSAAAEITRQRRRELTEAETRLAIAEQNLKHLTKDHQQISTQIADLKISRS